MKVTDEQKQRAKAQDVAIVYTSLTGIEAKRNFPCIRGHGTKTGCASVHKAINKIYCFSCRGYWDTIELVKEVKGLRHYEAIRWILGESFTPIGNKNQSPQYPPATAKSPTKKTPNPKLYQSFLTYLSENGGDAEAIGYLCSRDISRETAINSGIRAIPKGLNIYTLSKKMGVPIEDLMACGIGSESHKSQKKYISFFAHRLVIPFIDRHGNIVTLQGRDVDGVSQNGKYRLLGGVSSAIYNEGVVYTTSKTLNICEGVIDALSFIELELGTWDNTIAITGANANKGISLIPHIHKRGLNVVLCVDADDSGDMFKDNFRNKWGKGRGSLVRFDLMGYKDVNELLKARRNKTMTEDFKFETLVEGVQDEGRFSFPHRGDIYLKNRVIEPVEPLGLGARFEMLDKLKLFSKGLITIGGKASTGKTSLAIDLSLSLVLRKRGRVVFYSLDDDVDFSWQKIVTVLEAHKHPKKGHPIIMEGATIYTEKEISYNDLQPETREALRDVHVLETLKIDKMKDEIKNLTHEDKHIIVIVDYCQKIPKESNETIADIALKLKDIQKSTKCIMILLSQVTKEQKDDKDPFYGSIEIKNVSDVCLVLTENSHTLDYPRLMEVVKMKRGAKGDKFNYKITKAYTIEIQPKEEVKAPIQD